MMIVNAITKIAGIKGFYIPTKMECGVCVLFPMKNYDEQVQTFHKKNKVHSLPFDCFQRIMANSSPLNLISRKQLL